MMQFIKKKKGLALAVVALFFFLLLIAHFWGFTGPFGFDDLEYARLAHLIFRGAPEWGNPFTFRFGVVLPTGLFYALFGISDGVSAIYPLLTSLGMLWLISYNLNGKAYPTFLACSLAFCCPWIIFYSDKIGADIPVTLYMLLAITCLANARFNRFWQQKPLLNGVLFALSLFLALLTKATVWFLFPLIAFFFIGDMIRKKRRHFWASAVLGVLILVFFYSLWQKIYFNDWFYRVKLIKLNDGVSLCAYDRQPFEVTLKRIGYELWLHFIRESAFVVPVVMLLGCINKAVFSRKMTKANFWLFSAFILLLSANFWTISYHAYRPLCVDIRHYLYIFPVSAVAIAYHHKKLRRTWALIAVLLAGVLVVAFAQQWSIKPIAYHQAIALSFIMLGMLLFKKYRKYGLLLVVVLPLLNVVQQIKAAKIYRYGAQKQTAIDFLTGKRNTTVYTSETQERLFRYYLGFEDKNKLRLVQYAHFDTLSAGYHYWNYHTAFMSNQLDAIPPQISSCSRPENLIYDTPLIKVWRLAPQNIKKSQKYSLHSDSLQLWGQKAMAGQNFIVRPNQAYGPTFAKPIARQIKNIAVSSAWELKNSTSNYAKLVFSLEEDGKILVWKSFSIKTDKAAVGSFYTLYKSTVLNGFKIKKQATLKVYIWNDVKTQLQVRDATVTLVEE